MKLNEAIQILEANGFGAEITDKRLRKMLNDAGYSDVHLIKGDGYLYVDSDDEQHLDWLNALDSTSIYLNSFNQQSSEEWFQDIIIMLRKGRNKFIDKHPDGPENVNEDFGCGVADCGADQGIPQSGDCKAVPMMILGQPAPYGKIQKLPGGDPLFRRAPIFKRKKKKLKKKHKAITD